MKKDFNEAMNAITKKYSGEEGLLGFADTLELLKCLTDFSAEIANQLQIHFNETKEKVKEQT
jgi:hypothetical protein